jgi:hypothetical protein
MKNSWAISVLLVDIWLPPFRSPVSSPACKFVGILGAVACGEPV